MYKIIGGDGKEYGPVSTDTLRQWIREGRANAESTVRAEGAQEWIALGALPELGDVFNTPPPIRAFAPSATPPRPGEVYGGDYTLDVVGCLRRAITLIRGNIGPVMAAMLLYLGVYFALAILGMIPLLGWGFSLASLVISGPMLGGLYYVLLQAGRDRSPSATDVLAGFRTNFLHLFLGQLLTTLAVLLCFLPAVLALLVGIIPMIGKSPPTPPVGPVVTAAGLAILALPAALWLSTNLLFTVPLLVDHPGLDFWAAMKTSWGQVSRHWWSVFALLLLVAGIGLAFVIVLGLLALMDIFVLPTLPVKILGGVFLGMLNLAGAILMMLVNIGTIAQAYETLFTQRAADPGQGA